MNPDSDRDQLLALLKEAGLRTLTDRSARPKGYPATLALVSGDTITLDLPEPLYVGQLDQDEVGLAIVDPLGYPRSIWGLAKRIPMLRMGLSVFDTAIGPLMEEGGALYLEGVRYFTAGVPSSKDADTTLLVINAHEERKARRQASKGWRVANTLKRLGNALTGNQTTVRICVAAAHEIASAADLAGVLLWTLDPESQSLRLRASVGVNRKGVHAVSHLYPDNGTGCIAELVASSRQSYLVSNVNDHVLTANLEARFSYLKARGLSVWPLQIADRLIGVLELVGKDGDATFEENQDLFQTVAEHLSLALHSAALYEQAERSASLDSLTGIPNHRSMQQFLHTRMVEADRTGQELGAIMIDVDHFRSFNEEEGHDAGDEVLKMVAQALRACVRPYDLAARYGGEEFTILLPTTGVEGTLALAERARQAVESLSYQTASGRPRQITISLGCAVFPHSARDGATLLKAADTALYEAKRAGRNRTALFDGQIVSEERREAIDLEAVRGRLRAGDRKAGEEAIGKIGKDLERLALRMNLSDAQTLILRALVLVAPAYAKALAARDSAALEAMEASPEFRLLVPSLQAFQERFDGKGPRMLAGDRIPLLARALHAILALLESDLAVFSEDDGRLDPEIVALLIDVADAA